MILPRGHPHSPSGNLIGAVFVSSAAECLLACKDTEGCLWYTANPPLDFCGLYSTCGLINEAQCPDCRSGEWVELNLSLLAFHYIANQPR